ncbi:MAG: hypothetical protein KGL46_08170 [Hyphomicrobiales bacterium]|nr:hypothetical protein [Hyphomicrobiales bacterium]
MPETSAAPTPPPQPLREKALLALAGFMLTGVLGTIATTWIQQRGWTWQNRVAKIDKDTSNVLSAYQSASDLVNRRWYALFRMTRAIERGVQDAEWTAARTEFLEADKDWAIRYTSVARDIAFFVDGPFGLDAKEQIKRVWPLDCRAYPFGPSGIALNGLPARVMLEVVNHCGALVKDQIDQIADPVRAAPKFDAAERKEFVDTAFKRLDAVYRTNETLRCVMFDRASAIRSKLEMDSYWQSFLGLASPVYELPDDARTCLQ